MEPHRTFHMKCFYGVVIIFHSDFSNTVKPISLKRVGMYYQLSCTLGK